ncbi:hypothetical protein ACWFNS_09175 [Oerskovia enterophila]
MDILEGFETYEKQRTSPGAPPQVTLQSRGIFSLNPSAFKVMGSPRYVELLYAADRKAVALRAVAEETQAAYQVRPANNGGAFNVAGRAFMVFHGIELNDSRRYSPQHAADGVIVIGLDSDPYVTLHATRRKAKGADTSEARPSDEGSEG